MAQPPITRRGSGEVLATVAPGTRLVFDYLESRDGDLDEEPSVC
jgi:hypothetical protein